MYNIFFSPKYCIIVLCEKTIGIILVHDVTNKKSFENLQKWLAEVLNKGNQLKPSKTNDFDSEQYAGYTQVK